MSALVDKVSQKLGISREAAADRVEEFVARIQSATAEGSEVQVEALGTFTAEGGAVRFAPDSRLSAVVNHRFAGLAPIPVESMADAGHIDETSFAIPDIPIAVPHDTDEGPEGEHVASTSDVSSGDVETIAGEMGNHDTDPESVSAVGADDLEDTAAVEAGVFDAIDAGDAAVAGTDSVDEVADGAAPSDADLSPESDIEDADVAVNDQQDADVAVNDQQNADVAVDDQQYADHGATPDEESKREVAESGQTQPTVIKRKSRALFYFGMIVVLLVAIAGVLYLISLGDSAPSDRQDEMVESEAGTSPGGSEGAEVSEVEAPLITWEPGAIDRRAGGYTLIVSSQETVDEAAAVALELSQQLSDEGLPIDVLRGTARGETWYRVAIGQYSRQSVATRELRRLAEKLPEGAWVLRIRNNM